MVRFRLRPPFSPCEVTILDTKAINHCIESLCNEGCKQVNDYIARMEAGEILPQVSELELPEQQEVLRELKAIMAVYQSCSS